MAEAETHMSPTASRTPPEGTTTETKSEVSAKGGTDKPRNMPIVLLVSTVGAAVAMWVIWSLFFATG